jgi:cobyric acid synthase
MRSTHAIFVGGTASHMGRLLRNRGVRVAPFHALNTSNLSVPYAEAMARKKDTLAQP